MSCSIMIHFLHILSAFQFFMDMVSVEKSWGWNFVIKFDLKMRLFKSSAGLRRLWLIGVVRKHSIAKLGSLLACLALIRALLIAWICLSIKQFDFGNFGDDVMWSNCHCLANSLNASLEYCGPLSLTTLWEYHIQRIRASLLIWPYCLLSGHSFSV